MRSPTRLPRKGARRRWPNGRAPNGVGRGRGAGETPERIVHVARIQSGNEGEVGRLMADQSPAAAPAQSSIAAMTMFFGSGRLVV